MCSFTTHSDSSEEVTSKPRKSLQHLLKDILKNVEENGRRIERLEIILLETGEKGNKEAEKDEEGEEDDGGEQREGRGIVEDNDDDDDGGDGGKEDRDRKEGEGDDDSDEVDRERRMKEREDDDFVLSARDPSRALMLYEPVAVAEPITICLAMDEVIEDVNAVQAEEEVEVYASLAVVE